MNQKQMEFLISRVSNIYDQERKKLAEVKPDKPDLSNHLVAAILSGTVKYKSVDHLAKVVKERVLKGGKKKAFLTSDSHYRYSDDDEGDKILMNALDIFEPPIEYLKQLERYEKELTEWDAKNETLRQIHDSLNIKIQIGSDKVLDSLIEEADNLGSLQLVNSRLTIKLSDQKQLKS